MLLPALHWLLKQRLIFLTWKSKSRSVLKTQKIASLRVNPEVYKPHVMFAVKGCFC